MSIASNSGNADWLKMNPENQGYIGGIEVHPVAGLQSEKADFGLLVLTLGGSLVRFVPGEIELGTLACGSYRTS
ncbi:MAG: hypothetical protein MI746_09930 [Pseudomonadales bacterium]|nr:hypothetical protein [Pseudomonadales bacterium]